MKSTEIKFTATISTLKIFSSFTAMIGKGAKNFPAKAVHSKTATITSHKEIDCINLKSDL